MLVPQRSSIFQHEQPGELLQWYQTSVAVARVCGHSRSSRLQCVLSRLHEVEGSQVEPRSFDAGSAFCQQRASLVRFLTRGAGVLVADMFEKGERLKPENITKFLPWAVHMPVTEFEWAETLVTGMASISGELCVDRRRSNQGIHGSSFLLLEPFLSSCVFVP